MKDLPINRKHSKVIYNQIKERREREKKESKLLYIGSDKIIDTQWDLQIKNEKRDDGEFAIGAQSWDFSSSLCSFSHWRWSVRILHMPIARR